MFPLQRHSEFLVPGGEIRQRIAAIQTFLVEKGIDMAWIDHLPDRYYFTGSAQDGVLLIPAQGEPTFFARKSKRRAEIESPLKVAPYPGRKGLLEEIKLCLSTHGSLGMALGVSAASIYVWLTSALDGLKIVDIDMAIRLQKAVKSPWEISQISNASQQAVRVFERIGSFMAPGKTEIELSASIEREMRLLGHGGTIRLRRPGSDLTISHVASGDAALYPTNFDGPVGAEGLYPSAPGAGWKPIAEHETLMVDIVTSYNGYHADSTRTFYLGSNIPHQAEEAHRFCLDVLGRLEQKLLPGLNCSDIYSEIQSWAEKCGLPEGFMGYGENRAKFFGHGIGLELDEFPVLARKIDLKLEPGMVVAMEPKAFLKGIGPVGVENTYVVTESGCDNLCDFKQEIIKVPVSAE